MLLPAISHPPHAHVRVECGKLRLAVAKSDSGLNNILGFDVLDDSNGYAARLPPGHCSRPVASILDGLSPA